MEEQDKYLIALQYLINTDYIANKIIEYQTLGKEVPDYTDILIKREEAREVIRNCEKENE